MTTRIWWYPAGTGTKEYIEIGGTDSLSDWQVTVRLAGVQSAGLVSSQKTQRFGTYDYLRVAVSNFASASLRRQLESLEVHLKAGYSIAIAKDYTKAYAGFLTSLPNQGQSSVRTRAGNEFSTFYPLAALASGDDVIVRGGNPEGFRERRAVSGVSARVISFSDTIVYPYSEGPCFVRHEGFYPRLVWAGEPDEPILTTDRERAYTWIGPFREDWDGLEKLYSGGDPASITNSISTDTAVNAAVAVLAGSGPVDTSLFGGG